MFNLLQQAPKCMSKCCSISFDSFTVGKLPFFKKHVTIFTFSRLIRSQIEQKISSKVNGVSFAEFITYGSNKKCENFVRVNTLFSNNELFEQESDQHLTSIHLVFNSNPELAKYTLVMSERYTKEQKTIAMITVFAVPSMDWKYLYEDLSGHPAEHQIIYVIIF